MRGWFTNNKSKAANFLGTITLRNTQINFLAVCPSGTFTKIGAVQFHSDFKHVKRVPSTSICLSPPEKKENKKRKKLNIFPSSDRFPLKPLRKIANLFIAANGSPNNKYTVDGRNPAPPKKPGMTMPLVNTNQQWCFPWFPTVRTDFAAARWIRGAHDVLRGVRPCNCGFAVGPGAAHRGHHGAVQRALRARGARVAGHPDAGRGSLCPALGSPAQSDQLLVGEMESTPNH